MEVETIATAAAAVLTGLGMFGYSVYEFATLKQKVQGIHDDIADLRKDVDALIDFAMQRARVAAKSKGWVTENSPVKLVADDTVLGLYKPILHQLHDAYRELRRKLGERCTDRQLFVTVQSQFGSWISKNVCLNTKPPMGNGECIDLAMLLAKEPDPSDEETNGKA